MSGMALLSLLMFMPWIQEQGSSAKQSQGRATEVDRKKLELAFETLATSNDPKAVNRSLAVFGKAGFEAVPFLASKVSDCLLYTSPSPRDATLSRMPSSA